MRWLRVPALVLGALVGTLSLGALRLPSPPDLLLLPVAEVARRGLPVPAMLAGLAVGLVEDALRAPPRLIGLHAFSKVLLGYLLAAAAARTLVEKPLAVATTLALSVALESAVLALLLWLLRGEALGPDPLSLLLRAVSTGIVGALFLAASHVPWRARPAPLRRPKVR